MGQRFIFDIQGLTKLYGKVEIFKDVRLSFFPGAKIGVLGSNGAGKSTLLRIMAGVDKEFMGEAWPEAGASIGYVPQEPHLPAGTTVLQNVEEAVDPIKNLLGIFIAYLGLGVPEKGHHHPYLVTGDQIRLYFTALLRNHNARTELAIHP